MSVDYDKFVTGSKINEFRAIGCQLNTPLTSGSFTGLQGIHNTVFSDNEDSMNGFDVVLDAKWKHTGTTSWERPGSDLPS